MLSRDDRYSIIEYEGAGFGYGHGDEVYIAGEPGIRYYRIVSTEPGRGMVKLKGQDGAIFTVPASSIRKA